MPSWDFVEDAPPLKVPYGRRARTSAKAVAGRAAVDLGSAAVAASVLAPIITVIDRAVVQKTAGNMALSMGELLKKGFAEAARAPGKFLTKREFRLVYGVYAATYAVANLSESVKAPKLLTVTPTNMAACIIKDRAFALMFGAKNPTTMALSSYALFAARDTLTIGASYSAPETVAAALRDATGGRLSEGGADALARMSLPAAAQLVSTPLHVLALDLYNRKVPAAQRMTLLKDLYVPTVATRMMRIVPAFGVGSMLTNKLRTAGLVRLGLMKAPPAAAPRSAGAVRWALATSASK